MDRNAARQWLKLQIAKEPPILKQIMALYKGAQLNAFKARNAKKKRSIQDRLSNTPVTGLLRKHANVNPMALLGAGVATADHILELGASRLAARANIDADAASKWINAARDVKRAQAGDDVPALKPADWSEEDVGLVRALLALESAELLRSATPGLSYATDRARVLLKGTGWLRWKLTTGASDNLAENIAELSEWISSGKGEAHQAGVESQLARHLALIDDLRNPGEVARLWAYKREELLTLLREEVP
ncbi:hypothetical protein ACFPKZ_34435 [Streptosporangium amethystogenes subsp. fukuiense]